MNKKGRGKEMRLLMSSGWHEGMKAYKVVSARSLDVKLELKEIKIAAGVGYAPFVKAYLITYIKRDQSFVKIN